MKVEEEAHRKGPLPELTDVHQEFFLANCDHQIRRGCSPGTSRKPDPPPQLIIDKFGHFDQYCNCCAHNLLMNTEALFQRLEGFYTM